MEIQQVGKSKFARFFLLVCVSFAFCAPFKNLRSANAQDPPGAIQLHSTAANLYQKALESKNADDFELSADQWQKILTDYPGYSQRQDVQFFLGITYYHLKKFDQAAKQLNQLKNSLTRLKDYRRADRLLFFLAFCEYSHGKANGQAGLDDLNKALANYKTFFAEFPDSSLVDQALFFQGETQYQLHRMGQQNQVESAIASYQKLLDNYANSTFRDEATYAVGVCLEESGEYAKAAQVYSTFIQQFPEDGQVAEVHLRRADSEMQLAIARANAGDVDQANSRFAKAEQMFVEAAKQPDFARADHALYHQAYCLLRLNKPKQAADVYARIANEFADSEFENVSVLAAGKYYFTAGEHENASKWLQKVVDRDDANRLEAAHWLCRIDIEKQRFNQAFDRAKQFMDTGPANHPFHVYLIIDGADALYEQANKRSDSIAYYQRVADDYPQHQLAPKALYYAAFASLETGANSQAIKLAQKFKQDFPNDSFYPDTAEVLGEALLKENQLAGAQNVFEDLVDSYPKHQKLNWWHTRVGWARYLQGNYDDAISWLGAVVSDMNQPKNRSEAQYVMGASQFKLDQFGKAIDSFTDCLAASANRSNASEVQLLISRSHFELGQTDKAITAAKSILANQPSKDIANQTSYWLGEFLFDAGKYDEAVGRYGFVIENSAEDSQLLPDSYYGKAWALLKNNKHALAEVEFDHLIEKFPNHTRSADAMIGRGMTRRMTGKFAVAIEDFDRFLEGEPSEKNRFNAMYERGLAYVGLEDWDAAIKSLEPLTSGAAENPELADDIRYELAWANKKKGNDLEATKHFQAIADDYSKSEFAAESQYHLGQSLYDEEKYADAAKRYELCLKAIADDSIAERAAYKLGWSYFRNKDFTKARDAFDNQVEKYPNGRFAADGLFMKSESLFRDDKHALAVTAYKKAIPVVNSSAEVKENVKMLAAIHGAQSANKVKEYNTALEFAEGLIKQHPDSDFIAEAYFEIGIAQKGLGQRDLAVDAWNKAMQKSLGKTGARARCMVAEDLFEQKKYDDAVKQFKLVIYGYGALQSPDDVKPWQAFAAYEAARCSYVQIKDETNAQRKNALVTQAKDLFEYVVKNFPDNQLAANAKNQLEALKQIK